ncbi:ankyrin repeat and SOCS box protein 17 isoform X1 [Homo sapiens]|uniref:ankyrin repeat and SOCS box protein 17 isoform X1 n=1 Tax=Homo sapiens TaxID=9606 RepID=UPI0003EAE629|nr:ankyrin repeat and SOCS box protein 17 isoform X1 [Homo sapiens]XP_054190289.1 ankyrin repeat and SOCS box protein 17 isoform X1 [Homo sapiens]|eukprot:XP_006710409.1 ankyrin repeat and SOCS box protein 17 isoform X2 [Homo sapiens]
MSKSTKLCGKTSCPRSNIFCNLLDKIVKRPSLQFLGQWGYHCYEPRIYRSLAKILRTFTPVYCPSPLSGITPLFYVAQTRQSNIFKILLQYGILEREKNPINIVLTIVLYPSRVRVMVDRELADIHEDAKTCLVLCSRVLSVISVKEIKTQLSLGRHPIISNWFDYIPSTRYKDPCELLHLCRLTIRNQLLTNNMLPDGIFSLLIPARLQNYLNLEI